jgi:hypothetical protein
MKRLSLFAIALLLCGSALAQWRFSSTATLLSLTGTNYVAATDTNTYALDINVSHTDGVGIFFAFTGVGEDANPENVTLVFKRGLDGSLIESAETFRIDLAADSTNRVNIYTNLTVGREQLLRLVAVENANTNWLTNVVVTYSIKR